MAFDVHYSQDNDCLVGTFTGDFNTDSLKRYLDEVIKTATLHNCHRFLNDLREATINLSFMDFYDIAEMSVSKGFDRSWKRAIVVEKTAPDFSFFETVARNRGLSIRVFESMDEALEWLAS